MMDNKERMFTIPWVEKNLGFTRKTLYNYRDVGYIELIKDPDSSDDNRQSFLISEENLLRVWIIKILVSWRFSHKEINHTIERLNNESDYSFIQDALGSKIKALEEEKRQIEIVLGAAKCAKLFGYIPIPEKIEAINFYYCLSNLLNNFTVNNSDSLSFEYDRLQALDENQVDNSPDNLDENLMSEISDVFGEDFDFRVFFEMRLILQKLAAMSDRDVSNPEVQNLIAKLHLIFAEKLFPEYSSTMTRRRFVDKLKLMFSSDSDEAKMSRISYGKKGSEFIALALEWYAYQESL